MNKALKRLSTIISRSFFQRKCYFALTAHAPIHKLMKPALLFVTVFFLSSVADAQNIFMTACQGNTSRLDSLLQDTPIDIADDRGRSLLHWAVACKQKNALELLVKKGINLNRADHKHQTAMHLAVDFDNHEYFDLLSSLQTNSDWMTSFGASLLEIAVLKKNPSFIKKLINGGIAVDQTNTRGSTALEISRRIRAVDISDLLITLGADSSQIRTFNPNGRYMGQKEPGSTAAMFAPNFISTEEYEFGSVFNADGTVFYYGVDVNGKAEIRYTKRLQDAWSAPSTILSHEVIGFNDPFLSPDEDRLYFISRGVFDGTDSLKEDHDIWYVERTDDGWSAPINPGSNINSAGNEYYISFTKDGTMYFSSNALLARDPARSDQDIYASKFVNGHFQEAVSLGDSINTDAYEADVFVDPEENYLIFCAMRPDGLGRGDLYVSFKHEDGSWSKSMNMGPQINTVHHELCPYVTSDGKYFFYTSNEDIYWVSTDIIHQLRMLNTE